MTTKIEEIKNSIIYADVLDGLKKIPDESLELAFSSPPYNIDLKGYENRDDNQPYHDYVNWLKSIFIECKRILVSGGRLVINIDSVRNRQDDEEYMRPIYADLVNIGREVGLKFRTEICWYKQNWSGRATAFGSFMSPSNPAIRRNHEYLLVWSKDDWKLEGDQEMADMTSEEFQKWTFSTWFISPETRNLNDHPAPFPEELAYRVIKLFSYRGNTVLDFFMGTGTTGYVAKTLGRNYIGIDNSKSNVDFATNRINAYNPIFEEYIPRSKRLKNNNKNEEQNNIFG